MGKVLNYIWPVLLCIGGGFLASLLQRSAIVEWYPGLDKPSVTPPAIVFPIVWTVLYIMIGLVVELSSESASVGLADRIVGGTVGSELFVEPAIFYVSQSVLGPCRYSAARFPGCFIYSESIYNQCRFVVALCSICPMAVFSHLSQCIYFLQQLNQCQTLKNKL